MQWWLIVAIVGGAILFFILFILLIRLSNSRKVKFKKSSSQKVKVQEEIKKDEAPQNEEDIKLEFEEEKVIKPVEDAPFEKYDPFEDDEFEDEDYRESIQDDVKHYKDIMMGRTRLSNAKEQSRENYDDFEKFRNEHCYSKFMIDKNLVETLKDLPPEVRKVIFSDLLSSKPFDNINFDNKL